MLDCIAFSDCVKASAVAESCETEFSTTGTDGSESGCTDSDSYDAVGVSDKFDEVKLNW
jgi:hypothetical protein